MHLPYSDAIAESSISENSSNNWNFLQVCCMSSIPRMANLSCAFHSAIALTQQVWIRLAYYYAYWLINDAAELPSQWDDFFFAPYLGVDYGEVKSDEHFLDLFWCLTFSWLPRQQAPKVDNDLFGLKVHPIFRRFNHALSLLVTLAR